MAGEKAVVYEEWLEQVIRNARKLVEEKIEEIFEAAAEEASPENVAKVAANYYLGKEAITLSDISYLKNMWEQGWEPNELVYSISSIYASYYIRVNVTVIAPNGLSGSVQFYINELEPYDVPKNLWPKYKEIYDAWLKRLECVALRRRVKELEARVKELEEKLKEEEGEEELEEEY